MASSSTSSAHVVSSDTSSTTLNNIAATADYKVIKPFLPAGEYVKNTVFLHADTTGRPYQGCDFLTALKGRHYDVGRVLSAHVYKMNHLWAFTLRDDESKRLLVSLGELTVKGKRCLVFDPDVTELSVTVMWLLPNIPDSALTAQFSQYGTVVGGVQRRRYGPHEGMDGMENGTRAFKLRLKPGVAAEDVPHLINIGGYEGFVIIPGRAQFCLRCGLLGHIRRGCVTPRCTDCRRYGHQSDTCPRLGGASWADRVAATPSTTAEEDANDYLEDGTHPEVMEQGQAQAAIEPRVQVALPSASVGGKTRFLSIL